MPNFTGLAQGIDRGINLGLALRGAEGQREDRVAQREQRQQQFELTKLQLDTLKDTQKSEKLIRSGRAAAYMLASMQKDPEGTSALLQKNPEAVAKYQDAFKTVGQFFVDSTPGPGEGYQRIFNKLVPAGKDQAGNERFAIALDVTDPSGKKYVAPMTQNSSTDPNDPVVTFTIDDLGELATNIPNMLKDVEAKLVGLGDAGPLERMQAEAVRAGKREDTDYEFGQKKELARYEAGLKPKTPIETKHGIYTPGAGLATWEGMGVPADQIAGSNEDTALIKNASYLVKNAGFKTTREALDYLNVSKYNPQESVVKLTADMVKAQRDAGITEGDKDYRKPEQFAAEARAIVRSAMESPEQPEETDEGGAAMIKGPDAPAGTVKRDKNGTRIESLGGGQWRVLP